MSKPIITTKRPEEYELEIKLAELESLMNRLVQTELELTTLQAELQSFEMQYLKVVGIKIAKLDDIQAQIAEVFAKIHLNDKMAANEAKQARTRANESSQTIGSAKNFPISREDFKSSENVKSLYRDAAKRMHPDFAIDENDRNRRTKLMIEINEAYKRGDENSLRLILKEWDDSPESIVGDDLAAELIRTIRRIAQVKKRLSYLESEINLLMRTDLYRLKIKVAGSDESTTKFLTMIANQLDEQIIEQQKRLDKLIEIYIHARQKNHSHE